MGRATNASGDSQERRHVVLVRARSWVCALPATNVLETMRPLPIDNVANAPRFVAGVSVVRGEVVPILSLAEVLGGEGGAKGERFVLIKAGARRIALLVDEVLGLTELDEARLGELPPLLGEALPRDVARMGSLDGEALAVLDASRLLPEGELEALAGRST